MYQMLTGVLPMTRRRRAISIGCGGRSRRATADAQSGDSAGHRTIVMRALAGDVTARYQQAEDLLGDLLKARHEMVRRPAVREAVPGTPPPVARERPAPVRRPLTARVRTREISASRFCWNCHKPLPARTARCPFCGETQ
jgi:hypothetical protein